MKVKKCLAVEGNVLHDCSSLEPREKRASTTASVHLRSTKEYIISSALLDIGNMQGFVSILLELPATYFFGIIEYLL